MRGWLSVSQRPQCPGLPFTAFTLNYWIFLTGYPLKLWSCSYTVNLDKFKIGRWGGDHDNQNTRAPYLVVVFWVGLQYLCYFSHTAKTILGKGRTEGKIIKWSSFHGVFMAISELLQTVSFHGKLLTHQGRRGREGAGVVRKEMGDTGREEESDQWLFSK